MGETITPAGHEGGLKKYWHWVRVLIALAVIAGAIWLLFHQLKNVPPAEILDGARHIPAWRIAMAIGLTFLNYLILVGYDWAATRYVQHPLKLSRIAFASFICYAMSHNFGWIIGGPASRYRLYSAAGLTMIEIVKLVAILAVAYWTGFFGLAGVVFVIWPPDLPSHLKVQDELIKLPEVSARPLGAVFILGVCLYLLATALWRTPIKWRSQEIRLPPFRISSFLVGTAMLDIAVASSVLYAVLPPEMNVSLPMAMSVYLMAMVVVITLHIPGGVGVFETVVIAILAPGNSPYVGTLFGVLVVYRAIYYMLPLICASIGLAGHEIWMLRQKPKGS